jgi:hypothetical protein
MASAVSRSPYSKTQPTRGNSNRENREPAVTPSQVWGLLALPHQQRVMQVMILAGHLLAQREAKEQHHDSP